MPRGDRTGPAGMGPMTGRAAGYCTGSGTPGFMNPYGGRVPRALGDAGRYPYAAAAGGRGANPAYGSFRPRGRSFGFGFGRRPGGFGRGRGRR
jgi:hypothetical protein